MDVEAEEVARSFSIWAFLATAAFNHHRGLAQVPAYEYRHPLQPVGPGLEADPDPKLVPHYEGRLRPYPGLHVSSEL